MSKYLVTAPVDYVDGFLRGGHFEGEIEIPDDKLDDKDWIIEQVRRYGELLVDDYSIEGYGDVCLGEIIKLK